MVDSINCKYKLLYILHKFFKIFVTKFIIYTTFKLKMFRLYIYYPALGERDEKHRIIALNLVKFRSHNIRKLDKKWLH